MSTYDLLIPSALVVRARRGRTRVGSTSPSTTAGSPRSRQGSTPPTRADGRRRRPDVTCSPASSTPTSTGASTTRCREDAVSESRASAQGGVTTGAHLHAHRRLLPQQGRPLPRVLPRGARRRPRAARTSTTPSTSRRSSRSTSTRSPRWSRSSACRRSRSSCSTAPTACTAASTDQGIVPDDPRGRAATTTRTSSS